MVNQGEKGALQIPLLLAIMVITFGGFGFWGILRHWRFLMETQLRLNRCVGQTSLHFRDLLNSIKTTNLEIQALRIAIQAASLQPYVIPPLETALVAVVGSQEVLLQSWELKRVHWLAFRGCGKRKDVAMPLPELKLIRDPPDFLGPQILHWLGQPPTQFQIQVRHFPRAAAARIEGGSFDLSFDLSMESKNDAKKWTTTWCEPKSEWTNFF